MGLDHRVKLGLALALAASACKKPPPPPPPDTTSPVASAPKQRVDQVDPGELAEGPVDVFGLRLPRRFQLQGQFDDAAYASGEAKFEDVSNYVRQRVNAKHVDIGPDKTVFTGATTKSGTGGGRVLDITVQLVQLRTKIIIRDVTPLPSDGASKDEQLKRVGLNPDGTLLDPTHLR